MVSYRVLPPGLVQLQYNCANYLYLIEILDTFFCICLKYLIQYKSVNYFYLIEILVTILWCKLFVFNMNT